MESDADRKLAIEVGNANRVDNVKRMHEDGGWMISPKEAADLAVQTAFRISKGNGKLMLEWIDNELEMGLLCLVPRSGGAFLQDPNACHPAVPGCNKYMSTFSEQYIAALKEHRALIRVKE